MAMNVRAEVATARRMRSRREVSGLDYLRALRQLAGSMTQVELARSVGVTQPAISAALKSAAKVSEPRAGFSGADPYEIAQRYAAGDLGRDQVIDELARWDCRPGRPTDGYDWTTGDVGEFNEMVGKALDDGLLEPDTYDAILDRRDELGP